MTAETNQPPAPAPRDVGLWAGLLAGPVAWVIELQAVYALAEWACKSGNMVPLHLTVLACLLVALAGVWISLSHARPPRPAGAADGGDARVRLMAALGMMTGGLFALVILAHWIAVMLLGPCP